ncbi:MAG TPA: 50S ribosomal protein L29 [Nitrosospira sp.]|jgi:large subunit ribosomal protein L29|nr:50S ribosomal protein L29 [Nitrosospira sp.]
MKSRAKELRNKNPVELQQELLELMRAQFGLRMQHATQQLSNTCQLSNIRRDIARTKTILSQKARQS